MSPAASCPLAEIHELARARAAVYGTLRRFFLEPPVLPAVLALSAEGTLRPLEATCGERAVAALRRARAELPRAIQRDFQELLATPSPRFVRPWESVFRDERDVDGHRVAGLLMGPSTAAVEQFYRAAGAAIDLAGYRDLPDHVAAEFAFMAFLAKREAEADEAGRSAEAARDLGLEEAFLREHIQTWVPRLMEDVRSRAATEFYRGLADLATAFLAAEIALLAPVGPVPPEATR